MLSFKYILLLLAFLVTSVVSLQPSHFFYKQFEIDDVSNTEVIAPKSLTYVDEKATNELKTEALKNVQVKYDLDKSVFQNISDDFALFMDTTIVYQEKAKKDKELSLKTIANPFSFSENELKYFSSIEINELRKIQEYFTKEMEKIFSSGVTKENLESVKTEFQNNTSYYFFNKNTRDYLIPKLVSRFEPNLKVNEAETDKLKNAALESVSPVYKKISKGEAIIDKNEKITAEHIEQLEKLEMINNDYSFADFITHIPNILLMLTLFHFYCIRYHSEVFSSIRKYAFVYGLTLFDLILAQTHFLQDNLWSFAPFIVTMILFVVFFGRQFVITSSIFIGYLLNGDDFLYLLLCIIIGLSLSIVFTEMKQFIDSIKLGLAIGFILAVSQMILFYSFEQQFQISSFVALVCSGIFAGAFASGTIPFIEKLIGSATIYMLTELNKYDHPILEEMYRKAKGTYDHSRNVAHLVSVASNRIGTNTLLLKVAALYHDLGKIKHPSFFIENSTIDGNVHNIIDPEESAKIILEHPIESVKMCRKNNIPEEVIQLIACHHGDSVLLHFYQKALEQGKDVKIEDFQYKTPVPKTKEEGILLLADSVEAFSRSLQGKTKEELEKEIRILVYKKFQHGTLRHCRLTLEEVDICIEEFTSAIYATQHQRVRYQTDKVDKEI